MKKLLTLGALLCCVLSLKAAPLRTVEHPRFACRNTETLEIGKVELYKDSTVFYMTAYARPGTWVRIASDTYIRPAGGERLTVVSSSGLPLDTEFYLPESGKQAFTLTFPALNPAVYIVDFIEGEPDNCFKIFGIELNAWKTPLRRPRTPRMPRRPKEAEMKSENIWCDRQIQCDQQVQCDRPVQCTGSFELPLVKNLPATFSGKITGYSPRYFDKLGFSYYNPLTSPEGDTRVELPLQEDGTFSVNLDVLFPSQGMFWFGGQRVRVHFEPGRETVMNLDLPTLSCNLSRIEELHTDRTGISFAGELARVNEDLQKMDYTLFADQGQFWNETAGMTPAAYKTYVLNAYGAKKAQAEQLDIVPRSREIMLGSLRAEMVSALCQYAWNMETGYRDAHNEWDWTKPLGIQIEEPDSTYYDFLKDFPCNDERMLTNIAYCSALSHIFGYLQKQDPNTVMGKNGSWAPVPLDEFVKRPETIGFVGSDHGILYDLEYYMDCRRALDRMEIAIFEKPNFSEWKSRFTNPAFVDYLMTRKDCLDRKIEENKTRTGYTVNEVSAVDSLEQTISAILAHYKGKVVCVDIWETWCGPCRMAIKQMEPIKETFKGKDVVFVYLASDRSPKEMWEKMIPEIPGEHYRLDMEAFMAVEKKYGIKGVPTYLVVDKTGNIVQNQLGFRGAEAMKALLDVLSSPAAE